MDYSYYNYSVGGKCPRKLASNGEQDVASLMNRIVGGDHDKTTETKRLVQQDEEAFSTSLRIV